MPDRPNVLLFFVDQQRFDTLGLNGHPTCKTPALDRMASEGVNFTRAYSCCGLCSPARSSVMTGLYPHSHGQLTNTHDWQTRRFLDPKIPTFARMLSDAGYHTSYVGKVHLSSPESPLQYGFREWHRPYHQYLKERGLKPTANQWGAVDQDGLIGPRFGPDSTCFRWPFAATCTGPVESHREYWRAEEGIRILEERAKDRKDNGTPFFLRIDFPGPHLPFIIPEPYASMYDTGEIPEPPEFAETFERKPYMHAQMPRLWQTEGTDWAFWQPIVAKYWGYVTFLDHLIGRVMDRLRDLGLEDNTAVFYTTDHGDTCGSRRMFDKGYCMYEELYHIPFIASWPGVWSSGQSDRFINHMDLMPTFLELAGIQPPEGLDARSIQPLLEGKAPDDWATDAYAEFHGMQWGLYSQRMVRAERYKLVFNAPDIDELYDLESDPAELKNLIDDPDVADVQHEMYRRLFRRMQETGDPFFRDYWWPKYESERQGVMLDPDLRYGEKS
ncbi:MAG: sulfatase-like hydrolase/transferase [Planctomycetes bacterium]|nr:sulfatase-like hydrolase/transferase [Planctomycetota bacterium]